MFKKPIKMIQDWFGSEDEDLVFPDDIPPPPKSPTKLSGGTGRSPLRPIACNAPDNAI